MWSATPSLNEAGLVVVQADQQREWLRGNHALAAAKHLGCIYSRFPELNTIVSAEKLAIRVAARTRVGSELDPAYGALLALAICPKSNTVLGLALRLLSGDLSEELFYKLFSRWLDCGVSPADCTKMLEYLVEEASREDVPELIGMATMHLEHQPTASTLRLGGILQRWLRSDSVNKNEHLFKYLSSNMRLGRAVIRCRQLVEDWSTGVHSKVVTRYDSILLAQLSSAARRFDAVNDFRGVRSRSRFKSYRSGDMTWPEFNLERGSAFIKCSRFMTLYKDIMPSSGQFNSKVHLGQFFCYGPYMTLSTGSYRVVFLGKADESLKIEYSITSGQKTSSVVLAFGLQVRRSQDMAENELICFDIDCSEPTVNTEFKIYVHPGIGELNFQGININVLNDAR